MIHIKIRKIKIGQECSNIIGTFSLLKTKYHSDSVVLESVKGGRFSYICLDPFMIYKSKGNRIEIEKCGNKAILRGNPIEELRKVMDDFVIEHSARDLPFFFGGAIGYFGYGLAQFIEELPSNTTDDILLPDCYLIFPRITIAFDNIDKVASIVIIDSSDDKELNYIADIINNSYKNSSEGFSIDNGLIKRIKDSIDVSKISSNFSFEQYKKAVEKCKEYVLNGDSFQIKISQRLEEDFKGLDAFELYKVLRQINPAPYSAFIDFDGIKLVSCSPEHLISLKDGIAETRPIGGTYPRGKDKDEDAKLIKRFKSDKKELAEHTMLIDLERNDLGKVCKYGSIKVNELMSIEKYSHVFHIVTNIKGELRDDKDCFDLFKAMFPGGTVTGCPKVRTMEIIDEIEPITRGPYTGSIGFINFNKEMDLSIIIRTAIISNNKAYIQVGGGIVADSVAEKEYYETIDKGMALIEAIRYLKMIKGKR